MSESEKDEPFEQRQGEDLAAPQAETPAQSKWAAPAWARRLAGKARHVPKWVWLSGGALALLFVVSLLYFALRSGPGWTLVIRGAPGGSDVFVDNIRRGITSADGSVRVPYLRPGNKLVRVAHAGYDEFVRGVEGTDGDLKSVDLNLTSTSHAIAKPPGEIDYHGEIVLIPAGEFIMGADDHDENERPAHRVTLPDYYMDKYEVTNAQYKKFCDATGRPLPINPYWTQKSLGTNDYLNAFPDSPVIGISWEDATAYARWVGKRLPTEEEWEKAASWGPDAQSKRQWPWGNEFTKERANVGTDGPEPVREFAAGASAYGVFNMAGNVSEWVASQYLPYEGNHGSGEIRGENFGVHYGPNYRVTRGGSFRGNEEQVRTSRRDAGLPNSRTQPDDVVSKRSWLIGFRCAVSADNPQLQKFLSERGQ
ncbi:MAG TPA: SUMF1/EgtB/PvdO family nonheme iron enzyme [Pyrinomonadaceae bacterium]|jgi:formylglycine-generating enzyme required for sulfatase activity|nr:SUMF1/EgtB/PvdO family nonheme iron enzyme [Pyrinomonadaceae bacterium]